MTLFLWLILTAPLLMAVTVSSKWRGSKLPLRSLSTSAEFLMSLSIYYFFTTLVSGALMPVCVQVRPRSLLSTSAAHATNHYITYKSCTFTATFFHPFIFHLTCTQFGPCAFSGLFLRAKCRRILGVYSSCLGACSPQKTVSVAVRDSISPTNTIDAIARWHMERQRLNRYRAIPHN